MRNHIFEDFKEIEENVRKFAPEVIYKYRSDWTNLFHRQIITEQMVWFAAPRDLNDPYDIRIPFQFDSSDIENPNFLEKVKALYKEHNSGIAYTERDLNVICENKMEEIRKDPQSYFENNLKEMREDKIFDRVGIFSCTKDPLNKKMWAHYGNDYKGFVIGFNTVELARSIQQCGFGPVIYKDCSLQFSLIHPPPDDDYTFYLKSKEWEYEQEFRFRIIGEDENVKRIKKISINCISELLIGYQFPKYQKEDIIKVAKNVFGNSFPIFLVQPKTTAYGLEKI